jgi:hypothetical protein
MTAEPRFARCSEASMLTTDDGRILATQGEQIDAQDYWGVARRGIAVD